MKKTTYIKFFAPIDNNTVHTLMTVIDQKILEGVNKIVLIISSQGGSVFHGISAYNYLNGLPVEVETHNFGSVDSIGVVLFLSGKKRFAVPDSRFMMHPVVMNFVNGSTLDEHGLNETIKGLKMDSQNIASIIAKNTDKNVEDIKNEINNRTTLSASEAKDFGLIHEIKKELIPVGADLVCINVP